MFIFYLLSSCKATNTRGAQELLPSLKEISEEKKSEEANNEVIGKRDINPDKNITEQAKSHANNRIVLTQEEEDKVEVDSPEESEVESNSSEEPEVEREIYDNKEHVYAEINEPQKLIDVEEAIDTWTKEDFTEENISILDKEKINTTVAMSANGKTVNISILDLASKNGVSIDILEQLHEYGARFSGFNKFIKNPNRKDEIMELYPDHYERLVALAD